MARLPGPTGSSAGFIIAPPWSASSPSNLTLSKHSAILSALNRLARRSRRSEDADALARALGADAVLVFIADHELGVLRPAPGFPQTLPGGATWRRFLGCCRDPGEYCDTVAFPDRTTLTSARGFVAENGAVLVLLGGEPRLSLAEFDQLPFPLLGALLQAESAEGAAAGLMAAAREATARATALAHALDLARSQTEAKAAELRGLNETLEQRIADRTRELEKETEERRRAEAALVQSQKMEAVGQLTGGVAHDFNNLLSVIVGTLDLMETMAEDNPRLSRFIAMAQGAAKRGGTLTQQLLAFARRQVLTPQVVDLNELIQEYQGLLRRAVGEAVEVETRLCEQPCRCHIDPVHFETAILNLAMNARDAMPSGGTLTIATALSATPRDHSRGACVQFTMSDTGSGIPPEIVNRVFEPFFTTKELGKGTGLGLSQVYGFVRQSGGDIEIESAVGSGTNIRVFLPLSAEPVDAREQEPGEAPGLPTGCETVLVVEDDREVLDVVLASLHSLGYRTHVAQSGADALAILRTANVDLLFTDLVMPGGMSGVELARAAREGRPDLKVLMTSGYTAHPSIEDARPDGFPMLLKPYRYRELATMLRVVIDRSS
jgi:signal transduction histidine kinase